MGVNKLSCILKDLCEPGGIFLPIQTIPGEKHRAKVTGQWRSTKSDNTDNRSQKPPVDKQLRQPTRATDGKHFKYCVKHGVDDSWSFTGFASCVSLSGRRTSFSALSASGIFLRRRCTRLLLYFNTNKPHSFFFWQNTSCIRKPRVISGGGGGAHPLHSPPRSAPELAQSSSASSVHENQLQTMFFDNTITGGVF